MSTATATATRKPILPSKGRREAATTDPEAEDRSRFRAINQELRGRLDEHRRTSGATNGRLGKKLGYVDGTEVSKYLNDKFDRDPADFENRLADYFAGESRRAIAIHGEVIKTSVVRQFHGFADAVRRTNMVGVFHGPAGLGKTISQVDYAARNPTAVMLTANAVQNDAKGVRQLLWASTSHRGYAANRSRWDYMVSQFTGSGRLIIVDNAQRLIGSGRECLFDFRDLTGCPIVLSGNPAILQRVASNDQQFSRVLMQHEATLKEPELVARQIVDEHTDAGADIYDLAYPIAKRRGGGHLRSLVMTLTAMKEFLDPADPDPRRAFESALAKSIHHTN